MIDLLHINDLIPSLIDEIMMYFAFRPNNPSDDITKRTIGGLSAILREKYALDNTSYHKEFITICDRLCDVTPLNCLRRDSNLGYNNCYYWSGAFNDGTFYFELPQLKRKPFYDCWENAVFGPRYTYRKYKNCVLPLVYTNQDDDHEIGTSFLCGNNVIITARHCIEGAKSISFGKIEFNKYKNATVYFHNNPNIDVAVIIIEPQDQLGLILSNECEIFDKVITMGYPKIPGFTCFQTAEEAVISAIPEKRFSVTEGQVAAEAQQIWCRENLFLVTAKIKGGNSGVPVINQFGNCIGIVSSVPFSNSDKYDDLGYGTVMPAKFAIEILQMPDAHQKIDNVIFDEYPYEE